MSNWLTWLPRNIAKLRRDHDWIRRFGGQLEALLAERRRQPRKPPRESAEYINFYNDSQGTIPPFACMAITGKHDSDSGKIIYTVSKPSATFRMQCIPNGPRELEYQRIGAIPIKHYYKWLYDSGTPDKDQGWGPTPGQWYLSQYFPACTTVALDFDSSEKILVGTLELINRVVIKNSTGSSIGVNANGNFTIQKTETVGSEADAGYDDVEMRNRGGIAFDDGKIGWGMFLNGRWYAGPWECPA